jgi:hypothetical protein
MKYILLTQGKRTMVDDEDFEWLSQWKWQYQVNSNGKHKYNGYAKRGINSIRMHREIMERMVGKIFSFIDVDHKNGDTLDNQRNNLRLADPFQQNQNSAKRRDNTSGCRGVNFFKPQQKWVARIQFMGKRISLGYFKNVKDAISAYKEASKKYFGEYARQNP